MKKNISAKVYCLVVLVPILLGCFLIIIWQGALYEFGMLPPRYVSDSLSFNEKIEWLGKQQKRTCRVLASGSSMTLNNLYSDKLADYAKEHSYLNISSWGVNIEQNYWQIKTFLDYCKPDMVIIVSGWMDFQDLSRRALFFDVNEVVKSLNQELWMPAFMNVASLPYNIRNFQSIAEMRKKRNFYASLSFDSGGGVPLDMRNWTTEKRWDKPLFANHEIDQHKYESLLEISRLAKEKGFDLVFVESPVRNDVLSRKNNRKRLIKHVEKIRNLAHDNGFSFVDFTDFFSDRKYFADSSHLNIRGSSEMTKHLLAWLSLNGFDKTESVH